jgi:hypothetical protein
MAAVAIGAYCVSLGWPRTLRTAFAPHPATGVRRQPDCRPQDSTRPTALTCENLRVAGGGVVITTIQKFMLAEQGDRNAVLSDRRNSSSSPARPTAASTTTSASTTSSTEGEEVERRKAPGANGGNSLVGALIDGTRSG